MNLLYSQNSIRRYCKCKSNAMNYLFLIDDCKKHNIKVQTTHLSRSSYTRSEILFYNERLMIAFLTYTYQQEDKKLYLDWLHINDEEDRPSYLPTDRIVNHLLSTYNVKTILLRNGGGDSDMGTEFCLLCVVKKYGYDTLQKNAILEKIKEIEPDYQYLPGTCLFCDCVNKYKRIDLYTLLKINILEKT